MERGQAWRDFRVILVSSCSPDSNQGSFRWQAFLSSGFSLLMCACSFITRKFSSLIGLPYLFVCWFMHC